MSEETNDEGTVNANVVGTILPDPTIERQPRKQVRTRIVQDAPATIEITRKSLVEGEPPTVDKSVVSRNTLMIMQALRTALKDDMEKLDGITIRVSTTAEMMDQETPSLLDTQVPPTTMDVVMFEGPAKDVLTRVLGICVPPEYASMALQGFLSDPLVGLTECTSLQMIMVTMCFQDKGIGGFTLVNNRLPFEPGSALMMAEAVAGQLDAFKVEMIKKHQVQFPSDSKIITPGQKGFIPNLTRTHKKY